VLKIADSERIRFVTNAQGPVVVKQGPGCLIQILWFVVFIGSWLGSFAVSAAYFMFVFIVTIPIGIAILNNIPLIMALRQPDRLITPYGEVGVRQHNFLVRALWFIFVGWWLAAIALSVGYFLCMTIIGLPIGFAIFDMVPGMLTLRRS
jgi:uncharacterized membrane protein YccF (DUF307 family)